MSAGYVRVLAFGPIAEAIGSRTTKVEWRENLSIEEIVVELDMGHWLGQGLAVALNGERCPVDVHCQQETKWRFFLRYPVAESRNARCMMASLESLNP